MTQVPAGWYPDPEASPGYRPLRWWDGVQWTDHRQGSAPGPTGPVTAEGQALSGWWRRVVAYILDSLIVGLVITVVTLPAQSDLQEELTVINLRFQEQLNAGDTGALGDYFRAILELYYGDHVLSLVVLPILLAAAYHAVLLRSRGATLGKLALGVRVRRADADGQLSWGTVGARVGVQWGPGWLLTLLAVIGLPLGVLALLAIAVVVFAFADPLAALGQRRQTIHDRVAGTVVVRTR